MRSFQLRHSEWVLLSFFAYIAAADAFFSRPAAHELAARYHAGRRNGISVQHRGGANRSLLACGRHDSRLAADGAHTPGVSSNGTVRPGPVQFRLRACLDPLGSSGFGSDGDSSVPRIAWPDLIPLYLELCYVLVYGMGSFCVAVLWVVAHRKSRPLLCHPFDRHARFVCFVPVFPFEAAAPRLSRRRLSGRAQRVSHFQLVSASQGHHSFRRFSKRTRLGRFFCGLGHVSRFA